MSTERGFTLIELIIAIVILSAGVAGVLTVFSTTVKSSADPLIRKNMLSIAEQIMEEIVLKPYVPAANTAPTGCVRVLFNDVSDYNGHDVTGICDADGNAIPSLAAYRLQVSVTDDLATFAAATVTQAKKITVTVTKGTESLQLIGWRTNYAS